MKAHLKDTALPIVEGSDVTANCGVVIRNAAAIARTDWETEEQTQWPFYQIGQCAKCTKRSYEQQDSIRYTYAIVEGEAAMHKGVA